MPEKDLLVNAPLAHQRKLVDGVDRSTTHPAKTDSRLGFLRQPNRPNAFLKRGDVGPRAVILKLALATATDAGANACRCPALTRSAMGDRCGAVR